MVDSNQDISKVANIGTNTLNKIKIIEQKSNYELKKISINQAYKEIKKKRKVGRHKIMNDIIAYSYRRI